LTPCLGDSPERLAVHHSIAEGLGVAHAAFPRVFGRGRIATHPGATPGALVVDAGGGGDVRRE
ncbi:MAG: hypothetical protein M3O70_00155, partial [Actinomycetota bacterium]|nr:hypothetical protein [Actinomycetota bacterium]